MAANVETMFSARTTPWHGLGQIVSEALSSAEALTMAGLDWTVTPEPVYVDGNIAKGYWANVRSSDRSILGIVTERYQIVQNHEAFSFTDALLQSDVKYETAGSLAGGRRVWLLAKMDDIKVAGEQIDPYLVFTTSHDGSNAVRVALTPVKVVCQNTLTLALGKANRTWSAGHVGDMKMKLEEARRTLELTDKYIEALPVTIEDMISRNIYKDELNKFLVDLFPDPEDTMGKRAFENVAEMRDNVLACTMAPDLSKWKDTVYGVYNAVSDMVCHNTPIRNTPTYKENNFMRVADGHPVIQRAQKLLMEIGR